MTRSYERPFPTVITGRSSVDASLLVFGVVILTLSVLRFHKRLD